MKILKIAFKNINSLRGEHEIDFTKEPFLQNSLFAITGPTGSGKTTILDVISLALFNQVPRLGKLSTTEVLKKGAILTRNQQEAYAKITYECKQGIFASTWEISTARTGNLRDYHMELANLESGHLDLKKSDVLRAHIATSTPSRAKDNPHCLPNPLVPPVINATLPFIPKSIIPSLFKPIFINLSIILKSN